MPRNKRKRLRAFKCRLGVHRVYLWLGSNSGAIRATCKDCGKAVR